MSKKKSSKKTPARSASRRTSAAARSRSRGVRPKAGPAVPKIQLKPIRVLIARAIAGIQRLQPPDAYKLTIERLQRCEMELDMICDPTNLEGCGPNMEFPREALATSRS